jgi:uncharacterized lipoprotein YddW (UPF0748 family)
VGLAACAVLASSLGVRGGQAAGREVDGLWVVRTALVSPQAVDQVVDDAARAGFTALFVQVRGRGDAFYASRLVSRSPLIANQPASFDPLARLLERARGRGLAVHAWVNVLLVAHFGLSLPPGHVLRTHPQWAMVPRSIAEPALRVAPRDLLALIGRAGRSDPDVEGYYLSPSADGVGAHLEEVVREVVHDYPVDGLHLDFIRYPGPEYDYSRAALEGFARDRGGRGGLLSGPLRDPEAWSTYRRHEVTALVGRLVTAARSVRPGLELSAAVAPDEAQAVSQKFQDWPGWMSAGLLDAICPMAYTPDAGLFRAQIGKALLRTRSRGSVWAGIGAYRLPVDGTVERINWAREAGASGVVVFSHESFVPRDLDRLREGAFSADPASNRKPAGGGR